MATGKVVAKKPCCSKVLFVRKKKGNMAGLAKHLAKKYGGDPNFFTKCMGAEEVSGYPEERRKPLCAKAHKLATGHWPSQDPDRKTKKTKDISVDDQLQDLERKISVALNPNHESGYAQPASSSSEYYVRGVYIDYAICGKDGKNYKVTYSVDENGDVTVGDPVEVKKDETWTPVE
jgi:hypothetical protein